MAPERWRRDFSTGILTLGEHGGRLEVHRDPLVANQSLLVSVMSNLRRRLRDAAELRDVVVPVPRSGNIGAVARPHAGPAAMNSGGWKRSGAPCSQPCPRAAADGRIRARHARLDAWGWLALAVHAFMCRFLVHVDPALRVAERAFAAAME